MKRKKHTRLDIATGHTHTVSVEHPCGCGVQPHEYYHFCKEHNPLFRFTYTKHPEYFGYYDEPGQTNPAYDPEEKAPCLICGEHWTMKDVRTISFVGLDKNNHLKEVCYFYRVHKSCHNKLSEEEQQEFEGEMYQSTLNN